MSTIATSEPRTLAAADDDPEEPADLTVYPPEAEAGRTRWLTVDVSHVVSLDEAR